MNGTPHTIRCSSTHASIGSGILQMNISCIFDMYMKTPLTSMSLLCLCFKCTCLIYVALVHRFRWIRQRQLVTLNGSWVVPVTSACHAARKKKPNSCPALEGQVHLSGDIHALGKIFEAGGQPVKNREMRSLAQRGNQAKFFHRMPGIQRSPVAYNLQHLREYNSCRIWASQSRRPPYVADVEGAHG